MFLTQLRALLRAAAHGPIQLLVPMLAHAREIRQTLSLIDHARAQLDNKGQAHGPVKLGAMIEVPAAALHLGPFLQHFDFLSIGTNDLTQYTMAADRMSSDLATLTDPWQPGVINLVAQTARAGQASGKPVGVCGEAAADPLLACVLVGLGVTSLSAAASAVAPVGAKLASVTLQQCRDAAEAVLATTGPAEARAAAQEVLG
jgi:phosphotransferase system enzyme I (PtsI)